MEIESLFNCNLLFPTGRFLDPDELDTISQLAYYKNSHLSTKNCRIIE